VSSAGRKLRRKKQKAAEKELQEKMSMFDRLPVECSACVKPFDKKDKEMVTTWNVVVRKKEGIVRLYCPDCWGKAVNLIKEMEDTNV